MKATLHVLSVGSADACNTVRDALLQRHKCRLFAVTDNLDLDAIPKQEKFEIAILHNTLSPLKLRRLCEYVRRRWPDARILVIGKEVEVPDDPLYDMRILPGLSPETLLKVIDPVGC